MNDRYCTVCTEPFNKKNKKITCTSCDYDVCSKCVETYFQTSKAAPQCMHCHRPWNHQFILENLGNTSYKRINNVQKDLLYNEQKSLFPHTQGYVSLINQYNTNNDKVKNLRQQLNDLKDQLSDLYNENIRINNITNRMESNFMDNHNLTINGHLVDSKNKAQKTYIQACGILECKGFIGTNGVCGICSAVFCTKCMVLKNENHECNPDDVSSLELIKKDSKNCPKCNSLIQRISGCPDMFCTSCYTTFNWNTLKIDYNGNSNPMYYRWLREGTNIVDTTNNNHNCDVITMSRVFSSSNFKKQSKMFQTSLSKALQSLDHSNRYGNPYNYNTVRIDNTVSYETLTLQTRSKFMMNKITEKNFKTQLMKIHKGKEYNSNITQIRNMINLYKNDMMRAIVLSETFDPDTCIQEYVQFSEYINNCVYHIKTVFYNYKPTNDTYTGFIATPSQIVNRYQQV